jgi:hypothetical protein
MGPKDFRSACSTAAQHCNLGQSENKVRDRVALLVSMPGSLEVGNRGRAVGYGNCPVWGRSRFC